MKRELIFKEEDQGASHVALSDSNRSDGLVLSRLCEGPEDAG